MNSSENYLILFLFLWFCLFLFGSTVWAIGIIKLNIFGIKTEGVIVEKYYHMDRSEHAYITKYSVNQDTFFFENQQELIELSGELEVGDTISMVYSKNNPSHARFTIAGTYSWLTISIWLSSLIFVGYNRKKIIPLLKRILPPILNDIKKWFS